MSAHFLGSFRQVCWRKLVDAKHKDAELPDEKTWVGKTANPSVYLPPKQQTRVMYRERSQFKTNRTHLNEKGAKK